MFDFRYSTAGTNEPAVKGSADSCAGHIYEPDGFRFIQLQTLREHTLYEIEARLIIIRNADGIGKRNIQYTKYFYLYGF